VHGWTGAAEELDAVASINTWELDSPVDPQATGSIIQRLTGIPRASVFTFDYENFAARWVESNEQGTSMAGVIDCLYAASGHPVNIVAHSMGGLVVRQALKDTPGREAKLGQVVTIGTPNTGSDSAAGVANIGRSLLMSHPQAYPFLLAVEAMARDCGVDKVNDEGLSSACPGGKLIEGFLAEGGIALRTGSAELKRLPAWPESVDVHAIAGDYVVTSTVRVGAISNSSVDHLGDLIVSANSALDGADTTKVITCDLSLAVGLDPINNVIAGVQNTEAVRGKSLLACFHTGLLSNLTVLNNVIGTIQAAIEADTSNGSIDLSDYKITQRSLEPITPNPDLMSIETLKTDRQAMVGGALTTMGDDQSGAGSAYTCSAYAWCPAFSDAFTGGRSILYVAYRSPDGVSNFDQVEGFLLYYPDSAAAARLLPQTERGIGAGATRHDVEAAYADMIVAGNDVGSGAFPTNPDGRSSASVVTVLPDECGLHLLLFMFDENDLLNSIGAGTLWDNCIG